MLSDWQVGAGVSLPGHIDRLVARDEDGFPYVPAKTITGVWRDACETVARGFDGGRDGAWSRWVSYLFGDQPVEPGQSVAGPPRPAALKLRPAYLPQALRSVLRRRAEFREFLTFRKPGVEIDDRTCVARDDRLRVEEMSRGGLTLIGVGSLSLDGLPDDAHRATVFLLLAGARLVRRLGGKRRRGHGACRLVVLDEASLAGCCWDELLKWAETHDQPELPGLPSSASPVKPAPVAIGNPPGGQREGEGWVTVPLRLEALLPILAAVRTVGNVIESMDFLPGTYLLPPLMRRLLETGLDEQTLWQAVATGDIVVLPATPEVAGRRGLPVPLCLFHAKDRGVGQEPAYNRLIEAEPRGVQLKGLREGYLSSGEADGAVYAKARKTLRTHNAIHDVTQRPKREKEDAREGVGVYSYEAIASGAVLRSELRLRASVAEQLNGLRPRWWEVLGGEYYVGRSKKDDYGLVRVVAHEPQPMPKVVDFEELREIVVWLTSPAILRSSSLRPSGLLDDLRLELERRLRIQLQPAGGGGNGWGSEPLDHVVLPFRWDSWHAGWGLPRPSLAGLQEGSCARFVVEGDVPCDLRAVLAEVQAAGIGERRAEGFGQVCLNPPLLSIGRPSLREAREAEMTSDGGPALAPLLCRDNARPKELEFARLLERALWRDRLRRRAYQLAWADQGAANSLGITPSEPSASQLGNLRALVRRLRSWEDAAQARRWLERLSEKEKQRAAKGWPERSKDALSRLFSDRDEIWRQLNPDASGENAPFPVLTEDGAAVLCEELWAEAVQALVEATADFQRASAVAASQGGMGRGTAR